MQIFNHRHFQDLVNTEEEVGRKNVRAEGQGEGTEKCCLPDITWLLDT